MQCQLPPLQVLLRMAAGLLHKAKKAAHDPAELGWDGWGAWKGPPIKAVEVRVGLMPVPGCGIQPDVAFGPTEGFSAPQCAGLARLTLSLLAWLKRFQLPFALPNRMRLAVAVLSPTLSVITFSESPHL